PAEASCKFCSFGLIVTGRGEEQFLPDFFRSLTQRAGCSFKILSRIGQRNPISSPARKIKMVGSGKTIPTEDQSLIGLKARGFLHQKPCHFVILVDDIEYERKPIIHLVFQRYRLALDTFLDEVERQRAAVHFLAMMLEAYYFANSQAVNSALNNRIL